MVSGYSISDFGLFDFCVGNIDFLARPYGLAMVGEVRAFRPLQSSNSILHLLNLSSIKAIVIPSYRIGFNVFGDAIHFILIANNMIVIT